MQHRYSSSKQPRHFAAQMRGTIRRYAPYVALNLNQGPDDSGLRPYIADLAIFENTEFHCSKENHILFIISTSTHLNDNLQQQAFSVFDNLIANAENNDYTVSAYAFLNPKRTLAKNQVARSIDMSQLSTSGAFPSGWEMKPFNGGMRFTNGDTLLARITPCLENGKTAFIDFLDDGEVAFGSTEYIVLAPKNDTPPEMLYCLARYPAFVDYAVKNMNGSSGRQRVSAETVGQYRLPLFDKHSLVLFKEVVSPMFLKMRYNSLENMRLAELRDALLPKLMSGEIDVSAVQL